MLLQKWKGEEGRKDESEGGESVHIIHSMVLVFTLLDYIGQRGFEYSDIIAAMRIILNSS